MRKTDKRQSGFTMLEMIVAIAIAGVIATAAIPRFTMQLEKTRSAEALEILQALHKAQRAYYFENTAYTNVLSSLDVEVKQPASFNMPVVATADPIVSIQRSNNSYTLRISADGDISCVPAGSTCSSLGF